MINVKAACLAFLLSSTVALLSADTNESSLRATVGERTLPQEEKEALRALEIQAIESGSPDTQVDSWRVDQKIAVCKDGTFDEDVVHAKQLMEKSPKVFNTSHEGAWHHAVSVTVFGDVVELEDGSIFTVRPRDRTTVLNWKITDTILITPPSFFSYYNYELLNAATGDVIEVDLTLGPYYNGFYTHWIAAIDYSNSRFCLEDGSVWDIYYWHRNVIYNWQIGDTIMIGTNNGWYSKSRPNILINVNMNDYIKATCIY